MILEVAIGTEFLICMLKGQHINCKISEKKLDMFRYVLSNILFNRYKEHWFPENPVRGSGYRCIRINSKMDPVILQAGIAAGLHVNRIRKYFPSELTLWIDPKEVSYRIGENGSICVLHATSSLTRGVESHPRESPELYLDPSQMEQPDPMFDYVTINNY